MFVILLKPIWKPFPIADFYFLFFFSTFERGSGLHRSRPRVLTHDLGHDPSQSYMQYGTKQVAWSPTRAVLGSSEHGSGQSRSRFSTHDNGLLWPYIIWENCSKSKLFRGLCANTYLQIVVVFTERVMITLELKCAIEAAVFMAYETGNLFQPGKYRCAMNVAFMR